jgi:hypothetical protein
MLEPAGDSPGPRPLACCSRDLDLARGRLRAGRRARVRQAEEQQLRADLVVALERYADALAADGLPLPYRLRDELALYRRLDRG